MVSRQQYLTSVGSCLGITTISGCLGILPGSDDSSTPTYPDGTLIVNNTRNSEVAVEVTVAEDDHDVSLHTTLAAEDRIVECEFVTADQGDTVTLAAQLGDGGEQKTFQFLLGGGDDTTPEVAQLTLMNAVEASATWTATHGN